MEVASSTEVISVSEPAFEGSTMGDRVGGMGVGMKEGEVADD